MGEYATYKGQSVKIGTCENMYYLRYDQRHQVTHERGNVDPVRDAAALRFRFPWPDEDHHEPGSAFNGTFERFVTVPDMPAPATAEHHTIQFSAHAGYLISLPCPEAVPSPAWDPYTSPDGQHRLHRNGFQGAVRLMYQKYVQGVGLVPILACACGAMWREEDPAEIERIALYFRSFADRIARTMPNDARIAYHHAIADRILAGIAAETVAVADFDAWTPTAP